MMCSHKHHSYRTYKSIDKKFLQNLYVQNWVKLIMIVFPLVRSIGD